jgi:hypothetical protein
MEWRVELVGLASSDSPSSPFCGRSVLGPAIRRLSQILAGSRMTDDSRGAGRVLNLPSAKKMSAAIGPKRLGDGSFKIKVLSRDPIETNAAGGSKWHDGIQVVP